MKTMPLALLIGVCALAGPAVADEPALPTETPAQRDARMAWWRQAKFGLFIHWGVYAVPAGVHNGKPVRGIGEWIMHRGKIPIPEYERYARRFNPTKYDADAWVKLAKAAGMKYIVITSKHHDGFCLWDSKVSDYDVMDSTPFQRDILKELGDACTKHGIRLCFYHSIMDWHHPDARGDNFPKYRDEYMIPQLKELLSGRYGDIGVLWFDGEWIKEWTEPQGKALYRQLRRIKPDLIINNRVGKGRRGMAGMNKDNTYAGDFGTPEQRIPATGFGPGVDWESCMTMNGTWGYKSNDHNWKSSRDLVRKLVDIASKGGNFLLNVGPKADGTIPQPSVERLQAIGRWMDTHGEAIHGTHASPVDQPAWGRVTRKADGDNTVLYLCVFDWTAGATIGVPLANDAIACTLLSDPKRQPAFGSDGRAITVKLPGDAPDATCSVIKLTIAGRPRAAD